MLRKEENYEENKTNFEGTYLGNYQLKFGIGGAPPRGNSHRNFVCFCLESVELQMRENSIFFTPVKS